MKEQISEQQQKLRVSLSGKTWRSNVRVLLMLSKEVNAITFTIVM